MSKLLIASYFIEKSLLTPNTWNYSPKGVRSNGWEAILQDMISCSRTNENYQIIEAKWKTANKFLKIYLYISNKWINIKQK